MTKPEIHIEYEVLAERKVGDVGPMGDPCVDQAVLKIHNSDHAKDVIEFLRSRGFNVKLWRKSASRLIDEPFPTEEVGEERPDA